MIKLGFGLMRLSREGADASSPVRIDAAAGMADEFIKNGFTYFDTAAPYHSGQSEGAFREAVAKRYPRDAYTITDKLSLFMIKDEKDIPGFFEKQLKELGVDYIDIYLIHALDRESFARAERMKAFDFVNKLKAEGRIKHAGFSFHDKAEVLDEILTAHPEMEYVQLQINYLDWESEKVQSRLCYETAVKHGKPVIVMEPAKGGSLVNVPETVERMFKSYEPDMSVASWAIRFAASLENVVMVLSGMSNDEQIADNISYMKDFTPLSDEQMRIVMTAAEVIRDNITVPCTDCRYCVDDCPKKINIPGCFSVYNSMKREDKKDSYDAVAEYEKVTRGRGKAGDCIKCGRCEKHCPQTIPVRKFLEDISRELD